MSPQSITFTPLQRALLILWPSFLMAGVLEMLVFAVVDPGSLHWFGAEPLQWTRTAVYSVTFLIFWGVISTAGAVTQLLMASADEPPAPGQRVAPPRPTPRTPSG